LSETVTDVIVSRAREAEGLSTMVVWSFAAHAAAAALLLIWPTAAPEAPRSIMTVTLSGAPGPRTGGMTEIGGRAVQEARPEPAKPVEAPPAPKAPAMTLPEPRARTRPQPKPAQAPPEASAKAPSTGEQPREGTARTETRVRGQGFGLSSSGGAAGGPVQLDVTDFCCPEYLEQMRVFIQRTWEQNQGVVGSVGMKFTILRNGMIQMPQVERPSGFIALDNAALRALQLTTLPPLPQEFQNPTLTVHMRFDYQR